MRGLREEEEKAQSNSVESIGERFRAYKCITIGKNKHLKRNTIHGSSISASLQKQNDTQLKDERKNL